LVMDAVGAERVSLIGTGTAGTVATLLAATQPDRVSQLVLVNSTARTAADEGYPFGSTAELRASMRDLMRDAWGRAAILPMLAPELADDERFREWYGRFERLAASPGMALAAQRMIFDLDVRNVLSAVQCPTLVLHRRGDPLITVDHGRYLAEHLLGARYVELDGDGHAYWSGDTETLLSEIQTFVTGVPGEAATNRVLATVLFTDIVGSTQLAARLGDERWAALLDDHNQIARREFDRYRGREVDAAGDGFLATFDGPARAIRCASAIRDGLRSLGLEIRVGLHTGEVEMRGDSIMGIGVHIGARIQASAAPGEILVSRTVVDLVAGSGIAFTDRGRHALKGIAGDWHLFAVDTFAGTTADEVEPAVSGC
jgi:class 3 adenylate cyclase